jgi:hypothetical protein
MWRLWRALDGREAWERKLYKASLVLSVVWIILGVPISVRSTDFVPRKDEFMLSEHDPDFRPDIGSVFQARKEWHIEANAKNKELLMSSIRSPFEFVIAYWAAFATLLFFSDRMRPGSNQSGGGRA